MKVALVHDYLREYGGAERVLEALHEIFPQAPLYTSLVDPAGLGRFWQNFADWDIHPSFMQKFWLLRKFPSPFRFLAPWVWENFDLMQYDLVISSASWFITKGVLTAPSSVHICYCHTPPRYLYGYKTQSRWADVFPISIYSNAVNNFLRRYDLAASARVDHFIANSKEVQSRIKRIYNRDAVVIYPPIGLENSYLPLDNHRDYFLYVGRLARPKNVEFIVRVFNLKAEKLVVVGRGKEEQRLKRIAKSNIEFKGHVSDEELAIIYARAKALIFASEDEDFGITPCEAQSFGTPVLALRASGVDESVADGQTGLFFDKLTFDSLNLALEKFAKMKFNREEIISHSQKFSKTRFKEEVKKYLYKILLKNDKFQFS